MKDNYTKLVDHLEGGQNTSVNAATGCLSQTLENGDVVLPCNVAFVIKKVSGFNAETCAVEIPLTTVLRIKCSKIENREEVMKYLETELRVRINEVEFNIKDICNKIQRTRSTHCADGDKDMIQYTIRTSEKFLGDFS